MNCCVFAVPWLEFFGYGAYLWNVFWILDLGRFTLLPLAPEKVLGVHLMCFYHIFTWVCAGLIAFDPNGSRLVTDTCREAKIVMMPCILRRQTVGGDLPLFQVAGFVVIAVGFSLLVLRYIDAGQLLSSQSRTQRRERLLLAVRAYLRKQWLHFACLAICSILILLDTTTGCADNAGSYITSSAFPGLGLLLSLDRLVMYAKEEKAVEFGSANASPLHHAGSENLELGPAGATSPSPANLRSLPVTRASPFGAAGYRLLDFSALLEHLIQYLREEELQLAQQREVLAAGQTAKQAAASQLTLLRASARLDDSPDAQWDWTITASAGSETALTVIAPRSFTYLRRLANLDCEALLNELLQTNLGELRVAAKSGSSLLCSADQRTFVLKTVSKSEVKQVRAMLADYRKHLEERPESLLCRIYGCFSFRNSLGYFLHAVLMDCLVGLPASLTDFDYMTPKVFDIKSEFQDGGFRSSFPQGLQLPDLHFAQDLNFLSSLGVVDYSILLSVWEIPEELGHELSQKDIRPGVLVPGTSERPWYVVRLGIIDFLVHWCVRKRTESALKRTCLHPRHTERVTIMDPPSYARRQLDFLHAVFCS